MAKQMTTKEYRKWVVNKDKPTKLKALIVYVGSKGTVATIELVEITLQKRGK
ncbi:hypothetical protein ACYSNU_07190 [Enterococcus sp. LJL120]